MKPLGTLFKSSMVRALLNTKVGSWPAEPIDPSLAFKWQTRRIVKFDLRDGDGQKAEPDRATVDNSFPEIGPPELRMPYGVKDSDMEVWFRYPAPLGPIGRKLYVKETFGYFQGMKNFPIQYRADCELDSDEEEAAVDKWKPSIFMPRLASRIDLEVMQIRVQRLQDISEEDAIAEGVPIDRETVRKFDYSPVKAYRSLWESINGPNSWDLNPWVFTYSLKRLR